MCNYRYCDCFSIIFALIAGIAGVLVAFFALPNAVFTLLAGIVFVLFALLLLAITIQSASPLADSGYCICQLGARLLIGALLAFVIGIVTVVTLTVNATLTTVLAFFFAAAFGYTVASLGCYLFCLVRQYC